MEDKKAAYDKEFREGVVNYKREHPDETFVSIGKKFGVHSTTVGNRGKMVQGCRDTGRGRGTRVWKL